MELVKRDPRGQGDRGELSAALWFASQGAAVFIPLFHSPRDFDLIADWQGTVRRVQVKTSTYVQSGLGRHSLHSRRQPQLGRLG